MRKVEGLIYHQAQQRITWVIVFNIINGDLLRLAFVPGYSEEYILAVSSIELPVKCRFFKNKSAFAGGLKILVRQFHAW